MKARGKNAAEAADKLLDTPLQPGFHNQYLEALKAHCYYLEIEGFKSDLPPLALEDVYVPLQIDADPGNLLSNKAVRQIWEFLPRLDRPHPKSLSQSGRGTLIRLPFSYFGRRGRGMRAASPNPTPSSPNVSPPRLAIIADPGYGKTTLLRHLTLNFANRNYRNYGVAELVPVLLPFRDIHSRIQDQQTPTLPDLVVEHLKSLAAFKKLAPKAQWFRDRLEHGKCLVMLDGLDEVPESQRQKVSEWANWQMQAYSTAAIATSRPHGYDSSLFTGVETVKILDFTPDDIRRFIDKWYEVIVRRQKWDVLWRENQQKPEAEHLSREQVEAEIGAEAKAAADDLSRQIFASPDLTKLAKNPLLVTIIAATHHAYESLPSRRVRLYQKMFNLLLEDRPNRRETRLTLSVEDNLAILQVLALCLSQQEITQFTPAQGKDWIETPLARCNADAALTPAKFLQEIQRITGLLVGEACDRYEFTHKTFQEYLAAVEIHQTGQNDLLAANLVNDKWREVLRFYAALGHASEMIEQLLQQPEPIKSYALQLAETIKKDGNRINEALAQQLDSALQQLAPTSTDLGAERRLEQRLNSLISLDQQIAITADYLTWGEYKLFLNDQLTHQFHSQAKPIQRPPEQDNQAITDITWADARWFCAWLVAQSNFQPETGVYDYRLPTEAELQRSPAPATTTEVIPWSNDPNRPGNALRIVRQQLPDRYRSLLNYLATGRWQEADRETDRLMLEVAGRTEQGYLTIEDIKNFPCDDLRILDQLWVKFSGGRFGFSVQKKIYVECGATLDGKYPGQEIWEKFGDRVCWRREGQWLTNDELNPSLSSPQVIFPGAWSRGGVVEWGVLWGGI